MAFVNLNMLQNFAHKGQGGFLHVAAAKTIKNAKFIVASFAVLVLILINSAVGSKAYDNINSFFVEAAYSSMKLEQVHFAGHQRTQARELEAVLNISQGTPMLLLDLKEIKTQIENLPWVKTAAVNRQFPDSIFINIVERVPFALWQMDGEVWLIDEAGYKISQDNMDLFANMPFLVGAGAPENYQEIAKILTQDPILSTNIDTLIRVGDRRWDVMFGTGTRLRLPEGSENYSTKVAWLRFLEMDKKHNLLAREVAVYDMRIDDRMIVTLTNRGERVPLATSAKT
jgi:cell division protein FtsQ